VRLRLEGGSGRALNSSFETPLAAAPQDEAVRDERDHRPGHPLPLWPACPGHPDRTSAALQAIGITGTRPAMTTENVTRRTLSSIAMTGSIPAPMVMDSRLRDDNVEVRAPEPCTDPRSPLTLRLGWRSERKRISRAHARE
jgi:hypothetical protein